MASAVPSLDDAVRTVLGELEGEPGIKKILTAVRDMGVDTNSRAVRESTARIRAEEPKEEPAAEAPPLERYATRMPWIRLLPPDPAEAANLRAARDAGTCRGLDYLRAVWRGFEPRCIVDGEQLPDAFRLRRGLSSSPLIDFDEGVPVLATAALLPKTGPGFDPYAHLPPGSTQEFSPANVLPPEQGIRGIGSDAPPKHGDQSNDLSLVNSKLNVLEMQRALEHPDGFDAACAAFADCMAKERAAANIRIEYDVPVPGLPRYAYGVASKPIKAYVPGESLLKPLLVAYGGPYWLNYALADPASTPFARLRALKMIPELHRGCMPPGPPADAPAALLAVPHGSDVAYASWGGPCGEVEDAMLLRGLLHATSLIGDGVLPTEAAAEFLAPYQSIHTTLAKLDEEGRAAFASAFAEAASAPERASIVTDALIF